MSQKIPPNGKDNIIDMTAEVNTTTGEIIFKYQIEVENLALAVLGTAENIFFEEDPDSPPRPAEIPIGNNVVLEYDNKHFRGWILHTLNTDCI